MKRVVSTITLGLAAAGLAMTSIAAPTTATTTPASFSEPQVKQIQQIIKNYLVEQPQVLVQAAESLQQQRVKQQSQKAMSAIPQYAKQLLNDPTSPVVGNPQGKVTLVEFFDFNCPHCKDMAKIVDQLVAANPDLRVVYKVWPIFGPSSDYVAAFALAAEKSGKYQAFHDKLMATDRGKLLPKEEVVKLADSVGLNGNELEKTVQNVMKELEAYKQSNTMPTSDIAKEIVKNEQLARELGLVGTPGYIVAKSEASQDTNANDIGFVPGVTTQADLQSIISRVQSAS